jgi:anion-transporting  ArsA/GET3 family ATPase
MLRACVVIVDTVPEGLRSRATREVKALLSDPARTATVLVTLAEEMPVNEACELEAKLIGLGIIPQKLVVNQVYPDHFPDGSPVTRVLEALVANPGGSPLAELTEHATLSRDRHALNARYLEDLRRRAKTPQVQLPILFAAKLGQAHVRTLGELLAAAR